MKKIEDRLTLGIVTGLIASVLGRLLNALQYKAKLSNSKYGQMAAGLFISKNKINTKEGKLLGSIGNHILTVTMGTIVTYTLSSTGRDKGILKGIAIGSLYWLVLYGFAPQLGITTKAKKPLTPLLSFVDHLIFGCLSAIVVSKLGDDSLFPDNEIKTDKGNLPLLSK